MVSARHEADKDTSTRASSPAPRILSSWPGDRHRHSWTPYLIAILLTLATLVIRLNTGVFFSQRPLLIFFVFPILLSAYAGGLGPGLLATFLSGLTVDYFLIPPVHSFSIGQSHDLLQWLMLLANGVLISVLTEALHQSRRQVENVLFDHRHTSELLRESESRLNEAQRVTHVGSFVRDLVTGQGNWSDELFRILGYEPGEVAASPDLFRQHVHPDDKDEVARQIDLALAKEGRYEFDLRFIPRSGEVRHAHVEGYVRFDADGRACEQRGVMQDITARVMVEQRLRQSEKMEALGQIAGGVAHDFNNMLSAIMGSAELILQAPALPDTRKHAEQIVSAATRSADLARKLLAFSRKERPRATAVDLHAIIEEVIGLLAHSIDKRITVTRALRAGVADTCGDPGQLQNALLNLAINARDAMPHGGVLTFETRIADLDEEDCRNRPYAIAPGRYLQVSVSDTGVGMDRETMGRLFEPFFTTKGKDKGTGLGLATVYGAVRNHHGAVSVYSEPGRGSTFRLYLPLLDSRLRAKPATLPPSPPGGTARILLVDDEEVVRTSAADLLRRLGYTVTACADGREALDFFRESGGGVDLVILDLVMPKLDGRQTFLAMRELRPAVKALLASGYSFNDNAQELLSLGIAGFIEKPFQLTQLAQAVADALKPTPIK